MLNLRFARALGLASLAVPGIASVAAQGSEQEPPPAPTGDAATALPSADPQPTAGDVYPPPIQRMIERGIVVKPAGRVGDLPFWWLRAPDGRQTLVLTTPQGFLIRGQVYAPDGALKLDTEAVPPIILGDRQVPQGMPGLTGQPSRAVPPSMIDPAGNQGSNVQSYPETVWAQLGQATVIEEGREGAPLVYAFIDPYCAYCHQQWWRLRPKIQQGQLRVRWVPVAVLETSQRNIRMVLGLLNDPRAETLSRWIEQRQGQPDNSETAKAALARNVLLFQLLKAPSVPALLYKDPGGKMVMRAGVTEL